MAVKTRQFPGWRRRGLVVLGALAIAGALAASLAAVQPATANSIAVLVNDEPITEYDIAQRQRLLEATGDSASRQRAIDELVEQRLQLQAAQRVGVSVTPSDVDEAYADIAERTNMSASQFSQALDQIGVNPDSLKQRLRAQIAWRNVVRGRLQGEAESRQRDIEEALTERGEEATGTAVELTVRQIMFSMPEDASQQYVREREQDAQRFRSQFSGCDGAREIAGNFRDTAVQSPMRRNLGELPPDAQEMLSELSEGEISTPNVTDRAVELVAVCDRREVQDTSGSRAEIEGMMLNEQGERLSRRLLIDLEQAAVVEYR